MIILVETRVIAHSEKDDHGRMMIILKDTLATSNKTTGRKEMKTNCDSATKKHKKTQKNEIPYCAFLCVFVAKISFPNEGGK